MSDAQHTAGQQIGSASCSGTQCAAAAAYLQTSFPCAFTVAFHGAWMQ
jgi:hypothetical protein